MVNIFTELTLKNSGNLIKVKDGTVKENSIRSLVLIPAQEEPFYAKCY